MLDLRRIRREPEEVQRLLRKKGVEVDLDQVLRLDAQVRAVRHRLETLLAERNRASQLVAEHLRQGQDASAVIAQTRELGETIDQLNRDLEPLEAVLQRRLLEIPNTPDEEVPEGTGAEDNQEVHRWGDPPTFPFPAKAHWELGEQLEWLDFERARKISGSRYVVLRGWGARLSRALIAFMLDHARRRGYDEVAPPYLVNADSMVATGQFPKFVGDVFRVVPHEAYLIPTAEVPLVNLHRDEILFEKALPLKYVAYTACFRSEAGAAGRDTRGIIRQHQFDKVELVWLVTPESSGAALETLTADAEAVLQALELPFRRVLLCGQDMGFGQARTYDLEVWMPSYQRYVEISSCSNMTDFQARRANIRFRREKSRRPEFVHTLNGSGLAVGRTLAALLENRQTADGSISVPEALRPYVDGQAVLGGPAAG